MAYSPTTSTGCGRKHYHILFVEDGDYVTLVTNPQPSMADPARVIGTVASSFRVLDNGINGAHIVETRIPPKTYSDIATTEQELRDCYEQERLHPGV